MDAPHAPHTPPWFQSESDFDRLRDLFVRADFTERGLLALFGPAGTTGRSVTVMLGRTAGGSVLEVLARLFVLGALVDTDALGAVIGPMTPDQWQRAGLVAVHGQSIEPLVMLKPVRGLYIASDLPKKSAGAVDVATDFVMGAARSSGLLDSYTVRRPSRATLDLGTGSGYQALRSAGHSQTVLATDTSERAIGFARFNARLNAALNIEVARGDLFEPAHGRVFDLIVTNPPFVVSPRSAYVYRDSGLEGDQVVERIVRGAPSHLNEGGYCQVLCNWAHHRGHDWQGRLRQWFEGSGCDAWVLRSETSEAAAYASFWIRHTVGPEEDRPGGLFDEWTAYYERLGIEAVSAGLMTIRRRSGGPNWVRIDDEPPAFNGDCGEHVLRGFAAWDFLTGLNDADEMLATCFRLAPDVRASMELEPGKGGWTPLGARLRLASGMGYEGGTDLDTFQLMAGCDGTRPLRVLAEEMARALKREPGAVAAAAVPVVHIMLERGFLLPPEARA